MAQPMRITVVRRRNAAYQQARHFYVPEDELLGFSLKKALKKVTKAVTGGVKDIVSGKAIKSAVEHTIDIGKDVAKAAGSVMIAPTKAVINLATGKSVLDPFQQAGKHVGDAAKTTVTVPVLKPVFEVAAPTAGFILGGPVGAAAGTALFQSAKAGRDALKEDTLKRTAKNAAKVGAATWGAQAAYNAVTGGAATGALATAGKVAGTAGAVAGGAQQAYGVYQAIDAARNPPAIPQLEPSTPQSTGPDWLLPAGIGLVTLFLATKM